MPEPLKPRALQPGSRIAVLAPASLPSDPGVLPRIVEALRSRGFEVRLMADPVEPRLSYLAAPDEVRAHRLLEAFQDPEIHAILALRGGYGTARLLPLLEAAVIRRHPKILAGFSDLTALFLGLWKTTGLVTFYSPVATELARADEKTWQHFLATLQGDAWHLEPWPEVHPGQVLVPGEAEGRLLGGTLAVLVSLVGTPYLPDLRGAILFLEDVNEAPYRVDRMLTQLLQAGVLEGVKGIALGVFHECGEPEELMATLRDRLAPLGVPVCYGLPFGHIPRKGTLPLGIRVRLTTEPCRLEALEPAVLKGQDRQQPGT